MMNTNLFMVRSRTNRTVKSRNKNPQTVSINGKDYTVYASRFCSNKSAIIVSDNMTGKMYDFPSISTNCLCNPFCLARIEKASPDSICSHCFAEATVNHYSDLNDNCKRNFDILTTEIIPLELLPRFYPDVRQCRIESFGDVYNVTQAINYINIAIVNPGVNVTAWTKNPYVWKKAFEKAGKPANFTFILSSQFLNKTAEPSPAIKKWIDIIFTVYSPDYIGANKININCGARSCRTCKECYMPMLNQNGLRYVCEKLK